MRFWQRFQVEVGGRWQLFPAGTTTWKNWLFWPALNVFWPGRKLRGYGDMLDGCRGPGWLRGVDEARDPVTNLVTTHYYARYYWFGCALCVLGLDVGVAVLYRPHNEVDAELEAAEAQRRAA